MKYEVIIYWSDADKAFIAEVPELLGCAEDGPTHATALSAMNRIVREWIQTAGAVPFRMRIPSEGKFKVTEGYTKLHF